MSSLNELQALLLLVFLAFISTYLLCSAENNLNAKLLQNPCAGKRTCSECIQTNSCAWCTQPDIGTKARCYPSSLKNHCAEKFIWNPQALQKFEENKDLSRKDRIKKDEGDHSEIVQISPQRVSLKLRINEIYNLNIRYSQAEDYPVDLYYLMDLSYSMKDDKDKLAALGDKLSFTMRNITSNFRLGFGSFVDKVLMPFTSTIEKNMIAPCKGCSPPYGFQNVMSLSTDTSRFTDEVNKAKVSGNMDGPEGGFDAIMQAISCREQIGWRQQARRLLVFTTDAGFHYAGDGKLGGVIEPNDGECHLDSDGYYNYSKIQDYPSIAQINRIVKENSINVIFAVTKRYHSVYNKLSQEIEGSSTATLTSDSSNVVDLVKEEYNKISSSIEMKDNSTGNIKITYHSACLNGGEEIPTSKCEGLRVGDVVNFTAQILVTSCPQDPAEWHQVIEIYPVGINETLLVDIDLICSCPCENPNSESYEINSPNCNNHGSLACGICECNDLFYGRNCECSAKDVNMKNDKDLGCRADNETAIDCNGRGNCVCGVCECETRSNREEIISGRFCECDNFSCERKDQLLCSGSDHGVCECGACVCKPGWSGEVCDCQVSNHTCIPPEGGEICSGRGQCECGVCKCKATEDGRYSGDYCEKCSTCSTRCAELRDCVQCQMYQTGPLKNSTDCSANCTTFITKTVKKVEIDHDRDENLCVLYDENDCKFTFKYREQGESLEVYAEKSLKCPPQVFTLALILGVVGTIVLVGLATMLLWKLITTIHDKKEFARFEKERLNAKWNTGGNPLFTPATSTFQNPMYRNSIKMEKLS